MEPRPEEPVLKEPVLSQRQRYARFCNVKTYLHLVASVEKLKAVLRILIETFGDVTEDPIVLDSCLGNLSKHFERAYPFGTGDFNTERGRRAVKALEPRAEELDVLLACTQIEQAEAEIDLNHVERRYRDEPAAKTVYFALCDLREMLAGVTSH